MESFRTVKGHDLTIAEDFQLLLSVGCVLDLHQTVGTIDDLVSLARRIISIQSPDVMGKEACNAGGSGLGLGPDVRGLGSGAGEVVGSGPGQDERNSVHVHSTLRFLHAVVTFAQQGLPMDPAPLLRDHHAKDGNDVMDESGNNMQDMNAHNETSGQLHSDTIGSVSIYPTNFPPYLEHSLTTNYVVISH